MPLYSGEKWGVYAQRAAASCRACARFSQRCSDYAQTLCRWYFASSAHVFPMWPLRRVRGSAWWKSNQKNRSGKSNLCLNFKEGSASYVQGKGLQDVSFLSVGKQEFKTKKCLLLMNHSSPVSCFKNRSRIITMTRSGNEITHLFSDIALFRNSS